MWAPHCIRQVVLDQSKQLLVVEGERLCWLSPSPSCRSGYLLSALNRPQPFADAWTQSCEGLPLENL